jgi:CRP/FNR family transcriptional regulator, cyclic AMP receptor protein
MTTTIDASGLVFKHTFEDQEQEERAVPAENAICAPLGYEIIRRKNSMVGPSGTLTPLFAQLFDAAGVHRLKAGDLLFAAGDDGDGCYRLDKGLLKVTVTSTTGEERIVAILGPDAVVGELAMIDRMPRSASVVALRDSVLRFVSREAYEKRVLAVPETKQALLEILAFRLRQADEELSAATFLPVKARVARALLELAGFVGKPSGPQCIVIDEKISLADLAAMAGVARENASRVLSEWRRRNLVLTGTSPRYVLNDIAALERDIREG